MIDLVLFEIVSLPLYIFMVKWLRIELYKRLVNIAHHLPPGTPIMQNGKLNFMHDNWRIHRIGNSFIYKDYNANCLTNYKNYKIAWNPATYKFILN